MGHYGSLLFACLFGESRTRSRFNKRFTYPSRSVAFQLTLGAVGFAIGSEVTSLPLRASTQSIVGFTQGFAGWLVGFVSPFLINPDAGNLGAKVGFVFAGLGVPLCVIFYFLIPETKGLSFDDVSTPLAMNPRTQIY
jgi:hypothetical protein